MTGVNATGGGGDKNLLHPKIGPNVWSSYLETIASIQCKLYLCP